MDYPAHDMTPRPPAVVSEQDARRWHESARRRAMLDGLWKSQLEERVRRMVGIVRQEAWGETSLAINTFGNICQELSVLYDTPPDIRHDQTGTDGITAAMRAAGTWSMMQRAQYYALGMGEVLIRVHATEDGQLQTRPAFADLCVCEATPERPDLPVSVTEYRQRMVGASWRWTRDVLSVADPENPVYRVELVESAQSGNVEVSDISQDILGASMSGDAYPYRRRDGRPVLPYVMYHARRTGFRLWSPYDWMELVEGTLDAAVLHQMYMHTWRDASWPQRWVVNLDVAGSHAATTTDGTPASHVITDPASLLQLETPQGRDENTQPMVGQFKPGGDIAVMERGIADFVARLAQSAGVPPSDIQRVTGQAQSGAAISLNNEGKRSAQKRYAESFRDSDERLVMTAAILLNRATSVGEAPTSYVEGGYRVVYREIPVSPQERGARLEEAEKMLTLGLIDKAAAYRVVYPEATEADAVAAVSGEE